MSGTLLAIGFGYVLFALITMIVVARCMPDPMDRFEDILTGLAAIVAAALWPLVWLAALASLAGKIGTGRP